MPLPVGPENKEDDQWDRDGELDDKIDLIFSEFVDLQGEDGEGFEQPEKVEAWQQYSTLMKNKYDEDIESHTWANHYAGTIIYLEENHQISKPLDIPDNIMNEDNDDFFSEDILYNQKNVHDKIVAIDDSENIQQRENIQQYLDNENAEETRGEKQKSKRCKKKILHFSRDNFEVISEWLDNNSYKFRDEFKKCFLTNPDLQLFFDNAKIPDTYLPMKTQEAYFFKNVDDANEFSRYWRHERNMKHVSIIQYNDENHLKEILLWEAENGHIRSYQADDLEDNFEAQMFEEELSETDAGDDEEQFSSRTDLESNRNTSDINTENTSIDKKKAIKLVSELEKIPIAPGEHGKFQTWRQDVFIEEKAFPHLFPYGTGGYLSSCLSSGKNMGFSAYVRHRLMNADPKYRKDHVYIFFLLLVKEHIELKNCKSTYLRQARNTPGLTKSALDKARYYSLERYSRSFGVFKNMRGTAPYFEAAKKNVMATIRQRGAPTHFVTLSAAEYQWEGLLKSVYETVYKTPATNQTIEGMSASEKSKLITDNVVQTTLHFQKRVDKIMTKLIGPEYLEEHQPAEEAMPVETEDEDEEASSASYFYRIEFQARGAPHVHCLLWLKDKQGKSPLPIINTSLDNDLEQKKAKITAYHDRTIRCSQEGIDDESLRQKIQRFQTHMCSFSCYKKKENCYLKKYSRTCL
jgi:hypothetical protein